MNERASVVRPLSPSPTQHNTSTGSTFETRLKCDPGTRIISVSSGLVEFKRSIDRSIDRSIALEFVQFGQTLSSCAILSLDKEYGFAKYSGYVMEFLQIRSG